MTKFRRHIAFLLLTLFFCQSVLASIAEHLVFSSDANSEAVQYLNTTDAIAEKSDEHGHPVTQGSVDADCCHAHGHCHLLAFVIVSVVNSVAVPYGRRFASLYSYSYHFLLYDPLLRPPANA